MYGKNVVIIAQSPTHVLSEVFLMIGLCVFLFLLILLMIYKFYQSQNKDDNDLINYPKKLKLKDDDAP
jgi:energy-coupling factor transporter transmembrane protein EcfT